MAYRTNGDKLLIWKTTSNITTNRGLIDSTDILGYPKITTNASNRREPFTVWSKSYNAYGDATKDDTVFVRELLP